MYPQMRPRRRICDGMRLTENHKMPKLAQKALLALICLIALASTQNTTYAQQPSPSGSVRLDVVASHKNGPPVGGLEQKDFTVIDNKHTQRITSFRAVSGRDSKAKVIIVLDAVNIDFTRVAFAREEIDKYLRAEGGQLTRPTAFALLTDDGMKLQGQYSTDGNSVAAAVDANITGLRNIRRSSQYGGFDRYNISIEGLRELVQREVSTPERKIVLFVSPGWPLLSGPAVDRLKNSRVKEVVVTNTVPVSDDKRFDNLEVLSIAPLLANAIRAVFEDRSVSELFGGDNV